ncbi:MAG: ferrous iron transport protein A [Sedimentisphaerales bacterium]|nr:ferrous iron transport protein A [Sedimentisphaerales bacterium]
MSSIELSSLSPGGKARIVRIQGSSPFKKRLLEMGLIRGEVIEKVKLAPLADPAEYIIKGYHISMRNEEARNVIIEPI